MDQYDKPKQKIAVLGSTGSIGTQTLEVAREYSELFEITTLTAHNNWERLVQQALEFQPDSVVISNKEHYNSVKEALRESDIKIYAGEESLVQITENSNIDTIVSALVGFSGLFPTVNGVKHGKKIALANKESLVVAGEIVMKLAQEHGSPIIPVDSEHSAIFQSLVGEQSEIEKVILTASGGPFRNWENDAIFNASIEEALNHPNWSMGQKITIDSASLMNKGLEVIEAKWLFGVDADQIEVTVHPSSIIHSMVQFRDGAVKAQLGKADMKLPIQYALTFPERLAMNNDNRLDFSQGIHMDFYAPDTSKFPCLRIAYEAMRQGGTAPCIMNAANEVAVESFLGGKIKFGQIPQLIESCLGKINFVYSPSLSDYSLADSETRTYARSLIK